MRKQNLILFSSGESEKSGLLAALKSGLTNAECFCFDWRSLFADAHNDRKVALLPMLIKKIPSFDFAVLICEGHDSTVIRRGENSCEVKTMRDNVLFEIGLCIMALGVERVILLTDSEVRIPDDLIGVADIGLKQVVLGESGINGAVKSIAEYIEQNKPLISPVVVGAAVSAAEGYMTNFVLRTLESINNGVFDCESGERLKFEPGKLKLRIMLPERYDADTPARAKAKLAEMQLRRAWVEARSRRCEFNYRLSGDELTIIDLPTSLVASYNTAREILNINADDEDDKTARERFTAKELDLFEYTLRKLSKKQAAIERLEHFGCTEQHALETAELLERCICLEGRW